MSRLWSSGFELNSTTAGVEFDSATASVTSISTSTVRTGTYSLRVNTTATFGVVVQQVAGSDQNAPGYSRVYINIASLPLSNTIISYFTNAAGTREAHIRLTTTGTLQVIKADNSQLGSDSSALNTGTWYRVELKNDSTNATGVLAGLVDGTSFASGNNSSQGSWAKVGFGIFNATTADIYFDDIAVNDSSGSSQNSWPGEGKIIHLRPSSAGDNTTWLPDTGSNYARVQEVTTDGDTSYIRSSTTLNNADDYNVDDSGLSSSDTINLVSVGFRGRAETSATNDYQFTVRAKKAAAGTVSESSNINVASTSYLTNAAAAPRNYPLTLYQDPDSSNWTNTTLDSMQIGVKTSVTSTNRVRISTVWALVDYTPSGGIPDTVSVSDSTTVADSPSYYSDLVATRESYTVAIQGAIDTLFVTTSDTIGSSESSTIQEEVTVNVSDSSTVSENTNLLIPTLFITTSDNATLSESDAISIASAGDKTILTSDSVSVSENVSLLIPTLPLIVSDSTSISENVTLLESVIINVSDSTSITESINALLESGVTTSDTIGSAESIKLLDTLQVSVSDSTTLTESISFVVPTLFLSVNDSTSVSENVSVNFPSSYTIPQVLNLQLTDELSLTLPSYVSRIAFSTGPPTGAPTGYLMVFDIVNNKLYIYNQNSSAWVSVGLS